MRWTFIEAATSVALCHAKTSWKRKHVLRLYDRIQRKKGHSVAIRAVAPHSSEATFWVLTRQEPEVRVSGEPYTEPESARPRQGQAWRTRPGRAHNMCP
jgi:hypothetical protein